MQKIPRTVYFTLACLGRDRGFLCRDIVLYVATWFSGCRQLLGRDRGFPGRDRVVFLLFFCRDKGPLGVTIVFFFSCNNIATEVSLSRPRWSR